MKVSGLFSSFFFFVKLRVNIYLQEHKFTGPKREQVYSGPEFPTADIPPPIISIGGVGSFKGALSGSSVFEQGRKMYGTTQDTFRTDYSHGFHITSCHILLALKYPTKVMYARYKIQTIRTSAAVQMIDQHVVTMIER